MIGTNRCKFILHMQLHRFDRTVQHYYVVIMFWSLVDRLECCLHFKTEFNPLMRYGGRGGGFSSGGISITID